MLPFKKYAFFFFITLSLLLSASCELDPHSKVNRFNDSENIYKASLRWGQWMNLLQLQQSDPDGQKVTFEEASTEYLEQLSHIKVTHIENIGGTMNAEGTKSTNIYLIEFHYDTSTSIKKINHTVDWWFDGPSNFWYTSTGLPKEFNLNIHPQLNTIKLSPK